MPSPPPLLSASRAFRRLLTCRNGVALLRSSGMNQEKFVGGFGILRALSSVVGIETPSVDTLTNSGRALSSSFLTRHNAVQGRSFLGCGDGEEGDMLSKTHEERRVLGYSPEQLLAVVAAVDLYEDFVPWCQRSQIVRRYGDGIFDAELQIGFKFLVESYISHVELKKPNYIKTTASESGLFDHLINIWEFNPGPIPGSCDLYFLVDFKFRSPLYRQVASMFFKEVVSRLVSSFCDRCGTIYGPGVQVLEKSYGEQRL